MKKEGESCGFCFCPPRFTAGECDTGLKCDRSAQKFLPDPPGICRAEKKGAGILPMFAPYFSYKYMLSLKARPAYNNRYLALSI